MAEAIVSMVVGRLTDLLNEETHLLHEVRDEIQQVVTKLTWMKTFLYDADSRIDEQRVRLLVAEIRDLVFDAENEVERFLLKASSNERQRNQRGLKNMVKRGACVFDAYVYHHKFSNAIKHLLTKMENLSNCFRDNKIISTLEAGQVSSSSDMPAGKLKRFYSYTVVEPDLFVGFQNDVVSLVRHLEIQKQNKYLIVLDDIWTNDAWDSIKAAFSAETSGSKLLLTSRNEDLSAHVNSKCFMHESRLLTADQSWELLCLKALPKPDLLANRDFKEMEKLGREMVRNCGGLPLAIVVLGGVLVTKPTLIEWEKVYYDSVSSLKRGKGLGEDYQRDVLYTLFWSYNSLPTQLKPCFLYLGKFKEDEEKKQ